MENKKYSKQNMTLRDNVILAFQHKETYWVPNSYTDFDIVLQSTVNERYEGRESGTDEFGVTFTYVAEADAPMVMPGTHILKDITKWREEVRFPDVDSYDWVSGAKRDTAGWDRENKFSIVMMFNGPFERLHALMGFEEALIALIEEPEIVMEFIAEFQEYRKKLIRKIAEYYKPDAVMVFDDYGTAKDMMMSPDMWRRLIKPYLKQLIDVAHECGMYYIMHSCGYIKPIFQDIIELGPDAIQPMQYCNDVEELKKIYGKQITFTGGFNSNDTFDNAMASEDDMRSEVRRVLNTLGTDGSYIAWPVILSKHGEKIFIDEIMQNSAPKMFAKGVTPLEWAKAAL